MPRPCGPCSDSRRNELDRRLLQKELNGESFRRISEDFGYSETALRRHLTEHLKDALADIRQTMTEAREREIEKVRQKELEDIKDEAANSTASRLENAASFFDQLKEIRRKAANLLDQAETAKDLKAAGVFIRELREEIRLWAELEGKLQPQVNILVNPEWIQLRTLIINALEPYPEARQAVTNAIRK